jgi:molecular chaperone GrpE (heat shock protein)
MSKKNKKGEKDGLTIDQEKAQNFLEENQEELNQEVAKFQEIVYRVNEIGKYLRGEIKAEVAENNTKYLSEIYFTDVVFLLDRLGVISRTKIEDSPENV